MSLRSNELDQRTEADTAWCEEAGAPEVSADVNAVEFTYDLDDVTWGKPEALRPGA